MATKISNGESGLSVRTKLNYLVPETPAAFDPAVITLTDKEVYYSAYTQVGALAISAPTNNYGTGVAFTVKVTTDGSAITYPAGWLAVNDEYYVRISNEVRHHELRGWGDSFP